MSEEPGGDCVSPTIETIADGSYPVSRGLYIYVNNAKAAESPALQAFVDFYVTEGLDTAVADLEAVLNGTGNKSSTGDTAVRTAAQNLFD